VPYLKDRYATPPRRRALILGCGNGWVERALFDEGIAERFDAFDVSEAHLESARKLRGDRPITYRHGDFRTFRPEGTYDLIVNHAALHHARYLYRMMHVIASALDDGGIFVNWEYVGPNRNQYPADQLRVMTAVNEALPPRFRTAYPLLLDLRTFLKGDPTEAVHAAEILRAFEQYFEMVERHDLGGGVAYQILWNNTEEFHKDDPEAHDTLDWLLRLDERLTQSGAVPVLFSFFIGRPRSRHVGWRARFDRWVQEPAREAIADATGGLYPQEHLPAILRRVWGRARRDASRLRKRVLRDR
jgi:SAM-dependent methyltransferase